MLELNEKQKEATVLLSDKALRHILLYGGARSGKTFIAILTLVARAMKADGTRHGVIRKFLSSLKKSCWEDTLPKVCRLLVPDPAEYRRVFRFRANDLVLKLNNGSEICLFGLDDKERADRILGTEFSTLMFEECSELEYEAVYKALTRLAQKSSLVNRAYYTENPPSKRHWTYKLFVLGKKPDGSTVRRPHEYAHMRMNPHDNMANISEDFLEILEDMPYKQRLRFIKGEFQDDTGEGVVKRSWLRYADPRDIPDMQRIIVSVDPSISDSEEADEVGIVVAGKSKDDEFFILDDRSFQGSPLQWAAKVAMLFHEFEADSVLYESNQGGLLVENAIQNVDQSIPCTAVRAYRGKILRAESASVLYERGRVLHCRVFEELEDELCDYNGEGPSPNRLDAVVYALLELSSGPRRIVVKSRDFEDAVVDTTELQRSQERYLSTENEALWEAV